MRKILPVFLVFSVGFFIGIPKVVAKSTIELSNPSRTEIFNSEDEYKISARLLMENAEGKTYYLRGVFHQKDSTNYCGYTWNGSSWFKGPYTTNDGWKSFLSVVISSSSSTIELSAKVDTDDSGCKESGQYQFKVQRFTEGGSGSFDDQNEQIVAIVVPSPTPPPTSTPSTKQVTPTPHVIVKSTNNSTENKSPSPTPQSTTIILTKNSIETNQTRVTTSILENTQGDVLGATVIPSHKSLETSKDSSVAGISLKPLSLIFLGIGTLFIASSLFLYSLRRKKLPNSGDFLA